MINWTDLDMNSAFLRNKAGKYKLTLEQQRSIYDKFYTNRDGRYGTTSMVQLAKEYNVTPSTIQRAIEREQIRRIGTS